MNRVLTGPQGHLGLPGPLVLPWSHRILQDYLTFPGPRWMLQIPAGPQGAASTVPLVLGRIECMLGRSDLFGCG